MSTPAEGGTAPQAVLTAPVTLADVKCEGGAEVCGAGAEKNPSKETCSKESCNPETCKDKCKKEECSSGACKCSPGACKCTPETCDKDKCKTKDCGAGACKPPVECKDGVCPPAVGHCEKSDHKGDGKGHCHEGEHKGEGKEGKEHCHEDEEGKDHAHEGGHKGEGKGHCHEGENKGEEHCKEGKEHCYEAEKKVDSTKTCCEGGAKHKDDTSIMVWHPQTSPGQSPRSNAPDSQAPAPAAVQEQKKPELVAHGNEPEGHAHCEALKDSPLPQGDDLKVVLFDIDGTIADSDPIHFLAFQEILVEAGYNKGVPITHEFFIRQMSGKLNYVIAEELMPEVEEHKRTQMMDEKEIRYRNMAAKDLQPIPGFHQFIEWVKKRGLRRAAVTNSPRLNAEQVLTALSVTDFFELLVVGNECEHPKPFPDPYLKAINFFGVDPKQCFVLEDSPSGVKAGVAAGAPAVGLLTGHPGPVLTAAGASLLIKDYNDPALWAALGDPCDKQSCSVAHDQAASSIEAAPVVPVSA